ncbi:Response regulator [Pandoraea anapnoica]|uniref:Response regulator n=1 Tax=Pandoraea anapnoica TaxID=2508301 RepID=A0A5E5AHM8_9BURK|nr:MULTISPECIES: helix-turn-helix transcriptional regulator [Pandoraea]VVE42835.1 Response regulator [Pandoraea iniqua]VVE73221.1 Response regulator [Pandoraea anapnoica]
MFGEALYGERIVLIDAPITQSVEVMEGVARAGYQSLAVGNVLGAMRDAQTERRAALVLMKVTSGSVDAVARCVEFGMSDMSRRIRVMVLGPAGAPELRVQCFRVGALDYIEAGANREEVEMRIRIRMTLGKVPDHVAQAPSAGLASRRYEVHRLAVRYLRSADATVTSKAMLAARIGVSVANLEAAFKEVEGCSAVEFLRRHRIERARQMLSTSSMSVTAIAEMLGFSSGANFATAFRQLIGMSPSRFRENQGGGVNGFLVSSGDV